MMQDLTHPVLQSKLTPPRPHHQTLARPRLTARLLAAVDYRLTIVQAGAGYGKSTALAALRQGDAPLVWYQMDEDDADPYLFLRHLLRGLEQVAPEPAAASLAHLEQLARAERQAHFPAVVTTLTNELARLKEPIYLVLDDAHWLNNFAETAAVVLRLVRHAPPTAAVVLASRVPLELEPLVAWRLQGNLLEIGRSELAFTETEIERLFGEQYGIALTADQCALLAARTDGWPMALPLIARSLPAGGSRSIPSALEQLSAATGDLFTYLAQEVLEQLPAATKQFCRDTAFLPFLTADLCNCVRGASDSAAILTSLAEHGLVIVGADRYTMRYHQLIREHLCSLAGPVEVCRLRARIAGCCLAQGYTEDAIDNYLLGEQFDEAADLLAEAGRGFVSNGRLEVLENRILALPPGALNDRPALLVYLGDIARLRSRFDEALAWYRQAEERSRATLNKSDLGRALRGQARIYLDTVNPSKAERLLEEALRLSDGQEDRETQARLLDLLAENRLNQGRPHVAQELRAQAESLRDQTFDVQALPLRLMLRTGRLDEARRRLEEMAAQEQQHPVSQPRAHRETLLLLSIILAFQGDQKRAYETAVAGTERGRALNSPFITAIGWMRQGHAWLLLKEPAAFERAREAFDQAIRISDQLQAERLKVEAIWGLCQVAGFQGQLEAAEQYARQSIALAHAAGDEWISSCIRIALAAGYVLAGRMEPAVALLEEADVSFRACSDTHGEALTRLWQCLIWQQTGDTARLARDVDDLLRLVEGHHYGFLFERNTLLGPPDTHRLVPLLLFARAQGIRRGVVVELLRRLDLSQVTHHAGYQLRVHLLGPFRLWRGREEIDPAEWRRQKARQLFQLLLTHRGATLHREQIVETLWPDADPDSAERDFKVAYNALLGLLEPERKRHAPSAFILSDYGRYGIRPHADLWTDVAEFDALVAAADHLLQSDPPAAQAQYRRALGLYGGDYLEGFPYEEWAQQERRRLRNRYLRTAERLARSLLATDRCDEALDVSQDILAHDNCWEPAYQVMMSAYARLGNQSQVLRAYQQCCDTLRAELDVEPTLLTVETFRQLVAAAE